MKNLKSFIPTIKEIVLEILNMIRRRIRIMHSRVIVRTKKIVPPDAEMHGVHHREDLIPGCVPERREKVHILQFGAGGIGSAVVLGLARKGYGKVSIFDADDIGLSNLNRQLFFESDIGKPKGKQLALNLAAHATGNTEFVGYDLMFQDAVDLGVDILGDVVVCGVDCTRTVTQVAEFYLPLGIPVVFINIGRKAEAGLVFVQEGREGKACRGCGPHYYPVPRKQECFAAASFDVNMVTCGYALYAIESLIMDRPRTWNYRITYMAGGGEDVWVERRPDCPICGEVARRKIVPFPHHSPLKKLA